MFIFVKCFRIELLKVARLAQVTSECYPCHNKRVIISTIVRGSKNLRKEIPEKEEMSVLNVAEKNDVAKHIAGYLSGGNNQRREGFSVYNKIYEFDCRVQGQQRKMIMTSVSGHLLNYQFVGAYKKWHSCSPADLFEAPVEKFCPEDYQNIKRTLEREIRKCNTLIIWTDCDREGENIGFEIISVCQAVKRNIQIFRAKFSEVTARSAWQALARLEQPNELISKAVEVRSELDLRIGAAFTRFQTLRLQRVFPDVLGNNVISYGSCQFPTLGFVVERYKAAAQFVPERFWKISATHEQDGVAVEFLWSRVRLFDEEAVRAIYERCLENPSATVENVISKPKNKWRPLPLDTVEFEKTASRKLRLNVKVAMTVAEALYTKGFISYPRTETNSFPRDMDLASLVQMQTEDQRWGQFAQRVLENGPNPRQGKKSDQAHPPIHPTKAAQGLAGNEAKVYEYVVRHFLACVSKDAEGHETTVHIDVNGEKFVGSGLMILARNYLDVYPYENWSERPMHMYDVAQVFEPTSLRMGDGQTTAPRLLTEADLIALMEKHGIGTDATHGEHIEKIKDRDYVALDEGKYFVPGHLGIGLVDGYDDMGFNMSKPHLRAELEADLVRISRGEKNPDVVLREQIAKYKEVFERAAEQAEKIDAALASYLNMAPAAVPAAAGPAPAAFQCPGCRAPITVRQRQGVGSWYLGCSGYPECRASLWFPQTVTEVKLDDTDCPRCGVRQLRLSFQPGSMAPYYPNTLTSCLNGCDTRLLEMLDIQPLMASLATRARNPAGGTGNPPSNRTVRPTPSSGYNSMDIDDDFRSEHPAGRGGFGNGRFGDRSPGDSFGDQRLPGGNSFRQPPGDPFGLSDEQRPNGGSSFGFGDRQPPSDNSFGFNDRQRPNGGSSFRFGDRQSDPDDVCCTCGLAAKKLRVTKDSVNKGRWFFVCSKSAEEQCNFFQWADDEPVSGGGGDGWGGGGGGGFGGGGDGFGGGSGGYRAPTGNGSWGRGKSTKSTRGSRGGRGGTRTRAKRTPSKSRKRGGKSSSY